jgi:hypothetical protein
VLQYVPDAHSDGWAHAAPMPPGDALHEDPNSRRSENVAATASFATRASCAEGKAMEERYTTPLRDSPCSRRRMQLECAGGKRES